jgi:prepilin-type N-terminal cleavage/methylation domain-containing protein
MWDRMVEKRNDGGFTLIELLIVIIILAILAAIVVFAVGTTGGNAKTAACDSDAKTFETALESYKAETTFYPGLGFGQTWAGQPATEFGLQGDAANAGSTWVINGNTIGPFLRQLPTTTNYEIVTDGNGGVFVLPAGTALPTAAQLDTGADSVDNFDNYPNICQTNS